MKKLLLIQLILIFTFSCSPGSSQIKATEKVGGPCEGCEAIHESPIPFDQLIAVDTLPGFNEADTKIKLSGTVFKRDGKTPAPGVVLYIYHTNTDGIYPTRGDEKGWAKRHGYIRGWVKTDEAGYYSFYTHRPGAYPGRRDPQHIHLTIKEPHINEYYADDFLFDDDPLLTSNYRNKLQKRAGNGIIRLTAAGGELHAQRNLILGENIPDYPDK